MIKLRRYGTVTKTETTFTYLCLLEWMIQERYRRITIKQIRELIRDNGGERKSLSIQRNAYKK